MKLIVVGCGRVGSSVAREFRGAGWDVNVIDKSEDAFARLGDDWTGDVLIGHGIDAETLSEAGIENADAVVVTTHGDNTNLVIGQVARELFNVPTVVVRVLDPARAEFYATKGLSIVCPTSSAIGQVSSAVRTAEPVAG